MLTNLQIIVLAILQGLTEFLPVSSSAHLILLPKLLGWPDQGLAFDIAVHLGTLLAIISYFRKELLAMLTDFGANIIGKPATAYSKLAWWVFWGTIPVGIAGLLFKDYIEIYLRSEIIIAITTIIFGLLMGFAYWRNTARRDEYALTWQDVAIIGGSQILALIPGTSRSGITTTIGLMLGLTPQAASRYSFLLAIPVIFIAGSLQTLQLCKSSIVVPWQQLGLAFIIAGMVGYLCIHFFLKLLKNIGFYPFVIYRVLLGLMLLKVFW